MERNETYFDILYGMGIIPMWVNRCRGCQNPQLRVLLPDGTFRTLYHMELN